MAAAADMTMIFGLPLVAAAYNVTIAAPEPEEKPWDRSATAPGCSESTRAGTPGDLRATVQEGEKEGEALLGLAGLSGRGGDQEQGAAEAGENPGQGVEKGPGVHATD